MNCKGPCLLHCYYFNSVLLILFGIIIGYYISEYNKKNIVN